MMRMRSIERTMVCLLVFLLSTILTAQELQPFRDLNDITNITAKGDTVFFDSRNGGCSYDTVSRVWKIHANKASKKASERDDLRPIQVTLPPWYQGWTYTEPTIIDSTKGHYLIMVRLAGEGCVFAYEDIIDVRRNKIYRIPFQDTRKMKVHGNDLWLTNKQGITRISKVSGKRMDFTVLPACSDVPGWAENDTLRVIASSNGMLMKYDKRDSSITQIPITRQWCSRLLSQQYSDYYDQIEKGFAGYTVFLHFTNPVLIDTMLYIGVYPQSASYSQGNSAILCYNLISDSTALIDLGKIDVEQLVQHGKGIWCLGSRLDGYEGGDYAGFGGLVYILDSKIALVCKAAKGKPVGGFRVAGDTVWAAAGLPVNDYDGLRKNRVSIRDLDYARNDSCLVIKANISTMKYSAIYVSYTDRMLKKIPPSKVTLTNEQMDTMNGWMVRPRMIANENKGILVWTKAQYEKLENK